ncbi:hypothetical protein H0I23_11060 [Cellulophaga sp. HaHaR_3_176]|uniref:hypothetical protein n=1 Tax=Cellulophaga sp. HaHaR_3_176 TaxID=1942464 RepID=UPI001C1F9C5A|nr:hypothetical protein [Cellulophaga sp. HaHaR_3_176]QWX82999.1 hypothetical protein H0I23_11060 [Cellulophaga sp. HaHaR_3_176]
MKLFPTIEEVFKEPKEHYKYIFFPLLTLVLEEHNLGKGLVHFVSVWGNGDPDNELDPGNFEYNYIKFNREGNKYVFNGKLDEIDTFKDIEKWYNEADKEYQENKGDYLKQRERNEVSESNLQKNLDRREKVGFDYYHYSKGIFNYWITRDKYLETGKFIQGGFYSDAESGHEREIFEQIGGEIDYDEFEYFIELLEQLNENKEAKQFIGSLTGYDYLSFGEDKIHLFLDNKKNEVLLYSDWS